MGRKEKGREGKGERKKGREGGRGGKKETEKEREREKKRKRKEREKSITHILYNTFHLTVCYKHISKSSYLLLKQDDSTIHYRVIQCYLTIPRKHSQSEMTGSDSTTNR